MLALCLTLGALPIMGPPASAATVNVGSNLLEAYNRASPGDTIELTGNVILTEPLRITQDITISGTGTIIPDTNSFVPGLTTAGTYNTMVMVTYGTLTVERGVTFDGKGRCRAIEAMGNNSKVVLSGCTVQNGYLTGSGLGAGVLIKQNAKFEASNNTTFLDCRGEKTSATGGGALYVGDICEAKLDDVTFFNNEANSGGALYVYRGTVTCTANTKFTGNTASQRGGAIHNHGTVLLDGTTQITGNNSGQYGGAVYVSADSVDKGKLILNNATVTGNSAENSGGGVFIADKGEVYAGGSTKVTSNEIPDPDRNMKSNLFAATSNSKIITYSALSCGTGELGVSTSNPYKEKVLVYSLTGGDSLQGETIGGVTIPSSYTMTKTAAGDMSKYVYDSEVYLLKQAGATDNMWLTYNPAVGGGGQPTVIFDYNLPGATASVVTGAVGSTVTLPSASTQTIGAVTYKFLGWYTDPTGGSSVPNPVPIGEGTRVYYAQWDVETNGGGGGGTPGKGDMYLVYFDQNYIGGGLTTAYVTAGHFSFTVEYEWTNPVTGKKETKTDTVDVSIPFSFPGDPVRFGYTFRGWSASATGGTVDKGSWVPTQPSTTLYAIWTPLSYTLTWNANGGAGGTTTTQEHGSTVAPPTTPPTRTGYTFTGWYLDAACAVPLVSSTVVRGAAMFYAGWDANEYTITWDVNYTGGSVTTIQQRHDAELLILPEPVRTGYAFGGWYTGTNGTGTRAEAYNKVKGNETFYAFWVQGAIDYTVTVDWADQSDNDAVRPTEITVALTRNDLPTGLTYTLTAADADATGDKWSHTFTNLPETDSVSNTYTYSVAITSPVSTEYSYGIENKSATLGYILMTHTLITRDVNAFLAWDDAVNRDGLRPSSIRLQLVANGVPVADGEAVATVTGPGEAWAYTFKDVQKYYTAAGGVTGQEIQYSIEVSPSSPGELDGYTIDYSDYTATLRHDPATTSASVVVVWADSSNQDGKRPASMFVQLYADNVPLADKYVLLSDANSWGYTWDELYQYADGGREVVYSAHVTSTLVDYTAATTGMTIEMTYVPSSTTISAFATWQDGNDVDGLRPERLTVELVANGVPTGDQQVLSATNGWTTAWSNYPIYKNGSRIEYTFEVVDIPTGYNAEYFGIYDTSGLSVVLSHERILDGRTVTVTWDDLNDIAMARPSRVQVMLYADGAPLPDQVAVLDATGEWKHTFTDMPTYHDGGTAIRYSAYVVSEVGRYVPTTNGLDITMGYKVETVDVPLIVKWSDGDNSDGLRPDYVVVTLTIDGQPTAYQSMATADNGWTVNFTGMAAYTPAAPGIKINYGVVVTEPAGYTAIYAGTYCVLSAKTSTTSATPIIHWDDNNDQYGQRPDKLLVTLLADGVSTGKTLQVYAADTWVSASFTGLPKFSESREIVYSVQVAGAISNYDVTVAGMDVYLSHKAAGEGYTMDYTATVVWADNCNELSTRPTSAELTLYANEKAYETYTLTNEDIAGLYLWSHTFKDLPTKSHGADIAYTVGLSWVPHYKASVSANTITLTQTVSMKVTADWADSSNVDSKRPTGLTLRLVADGLDTDKTISMTGGTDRWVTAFEDLPVWSTANTTQQVKYTYRVDTLDASALAAAKYSLNYHSYELGAGSSAMDTLLYHLTLTRTKDSSGGGSGGGGNSGGGSGGGSSSGGSGGGGSSSTGGGGKTVQVSAYITGYSDGTFKPDAAIARCEAAAIMARVSDDYDPSKTYPVSFSDVPEKAWYRNYLGFCVSEGIITGYSDGTFKPMSNIDRGEFSAMAARFLSLEKKDKASGFKDVPASYWAEGYISQLSQRGIISGDGKGNFMPTAPISRAEVVKIVNGILSRSPDTATLQKLTADRWFSDVTVKHWAYYEIAEAAYAHKHS